MQLLGQTVNSYRYEDVGFAALLRAVAAVDGLERVRFTSPYPLDFSDDVIAAMAETPKICKHVHLPLQSAADSVLDRMRRGYTTRPSARCSTSCAPRCRPSPSRPTSWSASATRPKTSTRRRCARRKSCASTSAFTFAYSEREGTTAARKMPDTVPAGVKQRRLAEVIALQQRITGEIMRRQVGRRERILIEHTVEARPDQLMGRTDAFRPVIVPAAPGFIPGALVDVTITSATHKTLFGAA